MEQRSLRMCSTSVSESLANMGDTYVRKIELEVAKVNELEQRVAEAQEALSRMQVFVGGGNAPADTIKSKSKQLKSLENRLHKVLTKFNEAVVENEKIKQAIQDRRLTKQQHIKIREKLRIALKVLSFSVVVSSS